MNHLVGEAGGIHPGRRWQRQISQHCPRIGINGISIWKFDIWDYEALANLVKQKKIRREQMVAIVSASIAEVLFDLLQQEDLLRDRVGTKLSYNYVCEDTLYSSPLVFIQPENAWMQAQQAWESWQEASLEDISPNLAPVIANQDKLQQYTSANAYRSLTALVDGKQTLRDLALKLGQEPLLLTQSILPYVRMGLLKLVEVPDISNPSDHFTAVPTQSASVASPSNESTTAPYFPRTPAPPPSISPSPAGPLVAYIDDSIRDSKIMGEIVIKAGYRYINLQDSVLALPMLLEHKPGLIFLDLVMPIANGYEICAQIRRTSMFRNTPVIIVTGNDGIVDRVRAKLVRASDFIAKPITIKKVVPILRQYLPVSNYMGL